jgi:hypothetical protein
MIRTQIPLRFTNGEDTAVIIESERQKKLFRMAFYKIFNTLDYMRPHPKELIHSRRINAFFIIIYEKYILMLKFGHDYPSILWNKVIDEFVIGISSKINIPSYYNEKGALLQVPPKKIDQFSIDKIKRKNTKSIIFEHDSKAGKRNAYYITNSWIYNKRMIYYTLKYFKEEMGVDTLISDSSWENYILNGFYIYAAKELDLKIKVV